MRCNECGKFATYAEDTDPEVSDLEINEDGKVSGSVRIVLTCAEDGTELKEATFDIDWDPPADFDAEAHRGEGHELAVEEGNLSLESRTETTTKKIDKKTSETKTVPLNPRAYKNYYGYSLDIDVVCECKKDGALLSATITDDIQASNMDEC